MDGRFETERRKRKSEQAVCLDFAAFLSEHSEFPSFTELQNDKTRQTNRSYAASFPKLQCFVVPKSVDGRTNWLVLWLVSIFLSITF